MDNEAKVDKWRYQMRLLKWSAIILPASFFVLLDLMRQILSPGGPHISSEFIWGHMIVGAGIVTFSYFIFRFTSHVQKKITEQNSEYIRGVAVIQERERIAREMHDGMAQVLGYINTQSIALRKLLSDRKFTEAGDELARMGEIARELYSDVREGILGLRSATSRQDDFLPLLREYVSSYTEMSGVQVEIKIFHDADRAHLNPSAEIQLIRIAQESLTNVRKHSKVKAAEITIESNGDELLLTVSDNGQGFELTRLPSTGWPRFGLQTMKERAQAVGGSFTIESAPGKGCRVLVRMPLSNGQSNRIGT